MTTAILIKHISSLIIAFSILWAYEDGCVVNVVIATIATAMLTWSGAKEMQGDE